MKQRGFGLLELGMAIAALALIAGIVYGVKSYLEGIRTTADKAGYDRALKETAQRDKKELEDAQVQISSLTLQRDTQAALHATSQAAVKANHDKELANAKGETAALLRRIDTGSLVLLDPGRRAGQGGAFSLNTGGGGRSVPAGTIAAPADGSGQAQPVGLSGQASRFLLVEADRADEVATDLALCWGIARDDRKRLAGSP